MPRIADPDNFDNLAIKVCRLSGAQTEDVIPLSAFSRMVAAVQYSGTPGDNMDTVLKGVFERIDLIMEENRQLVERLAEAERTIAAYRSEIDSIEIPVIHVETQNA